MTFNKKIRIIGFLACAHGLFLLMVLVPARADIYRYVDSNGAVHFTNVPTSPKYRPYVHEFPSRRTRHMPNRYDSYIAEAARRYVVPVPLIKAVIKVESNFDPYAVSVDGARGLMQIMPATARALGVRNSFDPRENIFGGVRYLRELLTRYRGSVPLALAAYNAGPDRVDSLNHVPTIRETQRFVQKVLEYCDHSY